MTDSEQGHRIYGLTDGVYIIHELEAPKGYRRGTDQEIVVEKSQGKVQVFQYANYRKSSGGGGDTPDKPEEKLISFKKVDINGKVLPGAKFTFYGQDGTIYGTSVSGPDGIFRIRRPADGTYTFRETEAPAGYAVSDDVFSFTVKNGVVSKGVYEVINRPFEVVLEKRDGVTGQGIAGARLSVTRVGSDEPELVARTEEDGRLVFHPLHHGTYRIEELEAPSGYVRMETELEFTVMPDGSVQGDTAVYNFPTVVKTGRITAYYKTSLLEKTVFKDNGDTPEIVQTGDDTPIELIRLGILVCFAGTVICGAIMLRKRRGGRDGIRFWILAAAVLICGLAAAGTAWAEEAQPIETTGAQAAAHIEIRAKELCSPEDRDNIPDFPDRMTVNGALYERRDVTCRVIGKIPKGEDDGFKTVVTETFLDSPANHIPETVLYESGQAYGLKSYETCPGKTDGRTMEVQKQVCYPEAEAGVRIPRTINVEMQDPVTGRTRQVIMPLLDCRYTNGRWKDDWQAEAVVSDYHANVFRLGNELVRLDGYAEDGTIWQAGHRADDLFSQALLEALGLDSQSYQVNRLVWNGPAYEEGGIICRRLTASGRRMVWDCETLYGGDAALEPLDGQRIQAVYTKLGLNGEAASGAGEDESGERGTRRIAEYTAIYLRADQGETYMNQTQEDVGQKGAGSVIPGILAVLFSAGLIACCGAAVRADCTYREGRDAYEAVQIAANAVGVTEALQGGSGAMDSEPAAAAVTVRENASVMAVPHQSAGGGQAEKDVRCAHVLPPIREEALRRMNPDYRFWLYIPGTPINYPVVYYGDNQYYLNHRFDGGQGIYGSIFADCGQEPFNGRDTVLYGHNMKDGSMFGDLKQYRDQGFREAHPCIYTFQKGRWTKWEVRACRIFDNERTDFSEFITNQAGEPRETPAFGTGAQETQAALPLPAGPGRRLILSTCHGHAQRLAVEAVFVGEDGLAGTAGLAVEAKLAGEAEFAGEPELTGEPALAGEPELTGEPALAGEPELAGEAELPREEEFQCTHGALPQAQRIKNNY